MTGKEEAGPKTRPIHCCAIRQADNISHKLKLSTVIVFNYRLVGNQKDHQTDPDHMPATVAAGRLIEKLSHLFTTHSSAPKVRKTLIDQLTSKVDRGIGEIVNGGIRGLHVNFPIGCEMATYGLRNCDADGNTSTLAIDVSLNGRVSERYIQGASYAD